MAMPSASLSPRAQRTRTALLAAGFELLAERPIDAIAIDELVARAGVAKGSFFNHFADKPGFAAALAEAVRAELEGRVDAANAGIADPVRRLAGGMREAVRFALERRSHAIVMLRGLEISTGSSHELNRGIRADIAALAEAGLTRSEAQSSGVRYWLGLCQIAMLHAVERRPHPQEAERHLEELLLLGLCGLGVDEARARGAAAEVARFNPPSPPEA